jgi:hypothetical protein
MSLSRLWRHQGKRAKSRQLLGEVYGWFAEGFDTADLHEAEALLAELEWAEGFSRSCNTTAQPGAMRGHLATAITLRDVSESGIAPFMLKGCWPRAPCRGSLSCSGKVPTGCWHPPKW